MRSRARRASSFAVAAAIVMTLSGVVPAVGWAGTLTRVATPGIRPLGAVTTSSGAIWFEGRQGLRQRLGRVSPGGGLRIFVPPGPDVPTAAERGLAAAGADAVWFEFGPSISSSGNIAPTPGADQFGVGRLSGTGAPAVRFALPPNIVPPIEGGRFADAPSFPMAPDGAGGAYFVFVSDRFLGHITAAGTYSVVAAPGGARIATAASDGRGGVWLITAGGRLLRYDGTRFSTISTGTLPRPGASSVAAPDGSLWYAARREIVRVRPDGAVRTIHVPRGKVPLGIAVAHDGTTWFTALDSGTHAASGAAVGFIRRGATTASFITARTAGHDSPRQITPGITAGSGRSVWFASDRALWHYRP